MGNKGALAASLRGATHMGVASEMVLEGYGGGRGGVQWSLGERAGQRAEVQGAKV